MSKQRKFSAEFKREAVGLTRKPGVNCRQTALEIGINPDMLTRWRRGAGQATGKAVPGSGTPRDAEVAELKRELARDKQEREFLRAVAAFFAKESSRRTRRFNVAA